MTTTLRRLGFMLLLVLALAQHKDIEAQDHKTHSVPDTEVARCVNAAREACANVAAQMIASIEATCGHFGLGWACGLARSYWNAPREKDAEWVNGKCQQEALKQCTTAKP
ncbi:hypothetical protein WKW80_15935 [Variovorax humicola]|uniref:Uncharacterized protein n=1 Tax=Variovorax humicola TaxID=1769758 RepID=A0ABU8W0C1_9BURK